MLRAREYVPTMDEICTHIQKKPSDTYEGHLMANFYLFGLKNVVLPSMCQVYNKCYFNESNEIVST